MLLGLSLMVARAEAQDAAVAPAVSMARSSDRPSSITQIKTTVGWNGRVRLGRWNMATVEFTLAAPATCRLDCTSQDSDGHLARYEGTPQALAAGTHRVTAPFQLGRPAATVRCELVVDGWSISQEDFGPGEAEDALMPLVLSDRLIVTVGSPRGFTDLESPVGNVGRTGITVLPLEAPAQLPTSPVAYRAVDWLVLAGSTPPDAAARDAIAAWVRTGGRLIVSLPAADAARQELQSWLPLTFGDTPAIARELGALEAFAGRNIRIPYSGRLEVPQMQVSSGVVLAASREEPLLARVPWGLGEVVVLGLDITRPPLSAWGGLNDFAQRLVELDNRSDQQQTEKTVIGARLTSNGVSDLSTQLVASLDQFEMVERPAPWWSMAWMLGLLAIIGPLDYLLVHRVLHRPRLTWLTLPIWVIGLTAYAASTSAAWNGRPPLTNLLNVVDIDSEQRVARARSWATMYAPETGRIDCQLTPAGGPWASLWSDRASDSQLTGWFYVPETTVGGIYRETGGEWGRTQYDIFPHEGRIQGLPCLKWSTRTISAEWSSPAEQLIESDLRTIGLGRLTGSFSHHLPGTLTDWMLAYGSRVYRLQASREDESIVPLEAGVRLSAEHPQFLQGDLRSSITRVVVVVEDNAGRPTDARLRRDQTRYDTSHREAGRIWQVLSYHRAAGGREYSGLTNDLLVDHDFTRQLDLGRAVLLGRLKADSPAALQRNGTAAVPTREETFVRIVLPVRRSGEVVRELPKFDNDK